MEFAMAIAIGSLYAAGAYLLMRRNLIKLILGIVFIGHAANLMIFAAAGLTQGEPPFVPPGASGLPPTSADPLPQALILTAIVIGFGVLAFTLVMAQRADKMIGTEDLDEMKDTDR